MSAVRISTDPDELDLERIHAFLSQSYWSPGVPFETVQRAIEGSLCFGAYAQDEGQVGFARVVTDSATFAYLADVFVLPGFRGRGIARELMQAVMQHPRLQGLRRFMLATVDAHGLYERFGFAVATRPERLMERLDPDVYRRPAV